MINVLLVKYCRLELKIKPPPNHHLLTFAPLRYDNYQYSGFIQVITGKILPAHLCVLNKHIMITSIGNGSLVVNRNTGKLEHPSLLSRFIAWTDTQDEDRLLWMGIALMGHGCVLTPITVMVVLMTGAQFFLIAASIAAIIVPFITNLAALSSRITIPAFLLSIVLDIAIVAIALASLL